MTSEQRRHSDNGIHLCSSCAHQTDVDESTITPELLRDWKRQREERAAEAVQARIVPTFRDDIAKLVKHTQYTLQVETASRQFPSALGGFQLERAVTVEALHALDQGNLVLLGDAGAGKSVALLEMTQQVLRSGAPVLLLEATDSRFADPRSALGLERELQADLDGWAGTDGLGYLFIDGLDASRPTRAFEALFRLVRDLTLGRQYWRVCIATRTYDLVYSPELRALFNRRVEQAIDPKFQLEDSLADVAHVAVRDFDSDEFAEVLTRNGQLAPALVGAPPKVRQLLENPLNLRIAADIVNADPTATFARVDGRTDLLDLWWAIKTSARHGAGTALQREAVLRRLVSSMLSERDLQRPIAEVAADAALEALLSDGVVVRRGEYGEFVAFPHALVFDYAVYRLLLQTQSMSEFLEGKPDLALFAVGSLEMRLGQLWPNRAEFFRELSELFANSARRTLLMVAMRTVLNRTSSIEDLMPLLDGGPSAQRPIQYLIRTLIYERSEGRGLESLAIWTQFAQRMAQRMPLFEHDTLLLMDELLQRGHLTAGELSELASAARIALDYELSRDPHVPQFMHMVISAFVKTYDLAPQEAKPLLEQLIDPQRIARVGQYELEPLAYAVDKLHDPEALALIYERVFSPITVPAGSVHMGSSVIFGLVQDAQQTISGARYALQERFPAFLAEHAEYAIRALAAALMWRAESHRFGNEARFLSLRAGAHDIAVLCDYSNVWDDATLTHDPSEDMAHRFESWLRKGLEGGDIDLFSRALDAVVNHGRVLWLWRVLLRVASTDLTTATMMLPFVRQPAMLCAYELHDRVAHFFATVYERLTFEQRGQVDESLLGLLDEPGLNEGQRRYRRHLLTLYARELPEHAIATTRLRDLVDADRAEYGDISDEDREPSRGIPIPASPVPGPAMSFVARQAGANDELCTVIDQARPIAELANRPIDKDFVPPAKQQFLSLIEALSRFENATGLEVRARVYDVISAIILAGLRTSVFGHEDRDGLIDRLLPMLDVSDGDRGDNEDEIASWGFPWRFAQGVEALAILYRMRPETSLARRFWNLMSSADYVVRVLALRPAWRFSEEDRHVALEMAVAAVRDESIAVVGEGFGLAAGLWRARAFPDESARCIVEAYDRIAGRDKPPQFTGPLLSLLRELESDSPEASNRIAGLLQQPWQWPRIAEQLVIVLSRNIAPEAAADVAVPAQAHMLVILDATVGKLAELLERYGGNLEEYPTLERGDAEACLRLVAEASQRVYFNSGTMRREAGGMSHDSGSVSPEQFLRLRPILERLAAVPYAGNAYYLIKTLNGILITNPYATFEIAMGAFRAAGGALARDPMAEPEMRGFVLRYIREHRGVLAEHPEMLAGIMDVVDVFADGGTPQWMDVVFELDRVYHEG